MKNYFFTGVLVFLAPALPYAASFDCAKAQSVFEKTICSDQTLSASDVTLNANFTKIAGSLSSKAKSTMVKNQKDWLGYVQQICVDTVVKNDKTTEQQIQNDRIGCMNGEFTNRNAEFESLIKFNEPRANAKFYTNEKYLTIADKEEGMESSPLAKHSLSVVHIDSTDELATAFNAMNDAKLKQVEASEDFRSSTMDSVDGLGLQRVTDNLISLDISGWSYGHGAAHGQSSVGYVHYLMKEKRVLTAEDVFKGTKWKGILAKLAYQGLDSDLKTEDGFKPDDIMKDIADVVALPERWTFDAKGLSVHFGSYEVAAYSAGEPESLVPWEKLRPYLAASATTVLGMN